MTQTITELLCLIAGRLQGIDEKLAALLRGEGRLERQGAKQTMSILDGIQAQATQLTTLKDSLNASYGVIAAEIADLKSKLVDPALIAQAQAIEDTLTNDNTAIHDAIVANTPAAPEPPPAA